MPTFPHSADLSRRQLLEGMAAAVVACTVKSTARAVSGAEVAGYVDMHTHLGQTWNSTELLTAEVLLRWMDSRSIEQAVVLPLVSPEASSYPLTTDFVLTQTKPHRDRLIPFCSIDPRTSFSGGKQGLVDMLKIYIDAGARGFGEHKPGIAFDDPRNLLVFAACQEVGLPVLFHLDAQRNTDKPGLPGLEKVLRETPECVFIGHGPGWWASISGDADDLGGYPKGKVVPGGAIDRLMDAYPNIYGELSAGSGANAILRDREFGREFLIRRQDRVMFGSDFLSPGQHVPQFELFEQQLDLPDNVRGARAARECSQAARIIRVRLRDVSRGGTFPVFPGLGPGAGPAPARLGNGKPGAPCVGETRRCLSASSVVSLRHRVSAAAGSTMRRNPPLFNDLDRYWQDESMPWHAGCFWIRSPQFVDTQQQEPHRCQDPSKSKPPPNQTRISPAAHTRRMIAVLLGSKNVPLTTASSRTWTTS